MTATPRGGRRPPGPMPRRRPAQPGGLILDLACGAGSPTFEAARQHPQARVLGIDRAARLIDAARRLAADHAIGNAGFEVMSVDALALPDNNADAAISHLTLLQEGDVAASTRELARVLKDGAVQRGRVGRDGAEPADEPRAGRAGTSGRGRAAARPGLPGQARGAAGFSALHTELFSWQHPVPCWSSSPPGQSRSGGAIASLASGEVAVIRAELAAEMAEFRAAGGTCTVPTTCRLYWGSK